ncbi:MAG: histidine phosphatase family protein [Bdellovibrionales bacterium]|nr:histidine phosphatase family protein [Bdellovibrionales bacterium]
MKTIEHRRHALRTKPSPHLNAKGVAIAREVGEKAGPFARVISSPKRRAVETAVAMGFAVDETYSVLKSIPKDLNDFVPHDAGFSAFFEAIPDAPEAERYLEKLRNLFARELEKIPEGGRLLVVSHGGVVEWSALACCPEDARKLGNPVDKCEAVEIDWKDGRFVGVRVVRVNF